MNEKNLFSIEDEVDSDNLIGKKRFKKLEKSFKKSYKDEYLESKKINKNETFKKYYFNKIKSNFIIEFNNVQKFYSEDKHYRWILKNVNFKIPKGKIVTIIGQSGSGKTTLFNLISGLIKNELGEIIVNNNFLTFMNDKELTNFREKYISFVFQEYNLIPTLRIKDNILLGRDLATKEQKKNRFFDIQDIAKMMGIENHLHKFPNQISGGQQQRVSIARALIKNPLILLADEPTGALDTITKKDILKIIEDININLGTTILLITHSREVSKIGDIVIKVKNGQIVSFKENDHKKNAKDLNF